MVGDYIEATLWHKSWSCDESCKHTPRKSYDTQEELTFQIQKGTEFFCITIKGIFPCQSIETFHIKAHFNLMRESLDL